MALRHFALGLWAMVAAGGVSAQGPVPAPSPVPGPERPPPDWRAVPRRLPGPQEPLAAPGPVTIALDPTLGDAAPAVRAALARHGFGRIADGGDYVLATPGDFPLTLTLSRTGTVDDTWLGELHGEMGNLVLGDWRAPLDAALARIGRRAALLALPAASGEVRATTCWRDRRYGPLSCSAGGAFQAMDDTLVVVAQGQTFDVDFAVRNDARRPRYLTLVDVAAASGTIRRLTPGEDGPVAPGRWATASGIGLPRGGHMLITISSEAPIPDALLAEDPVADPGCASAIGAILCGGGGAATAGDAPDWAAASANYVLRSIAVVAVGGGVPVLPEQAPWMAGLYSTVPYTRAEIDADRLKPPGERDYLAERSAAERDHRCGGSRIAEDLVLTAAHCVAKGSFAGADASKVFQRRRIRLDTHQLGQGGTTYAIDGMAVHAGYRAGAQRDDIALLHIRADRATVPFPSGPALVTLPTGRADAAGSAARAPVTAFGWGYTGAVAPGARALLSVANTLQHNPDMLQAGPLEVMAQPACRQRVGSDLTEGMLCAVTRTTGPMPAGTAVFSCVGDSGGPLVWNEKGRDVLVGIASWSRGCGHEGFPSIYTDVGRYADWVAEARRQIRPGAVVLVPQPRAVAVPTARPTPRPEPPRRR